MDKRKLAKIKPVEATDSMINLAGQLQDTYGIVSAIHEKDLLILYVYPVAALKAGTRDAELRLFFTDDDYITQDLKSTKTKWINSKISYALDVTWYDKKKYHMADKKTWSLICTKWPETDTHYWYREILKWQEKIAAKRLRERHEKELEPTRKLMAQVPELPAGFEHWMTTTAIARHNFIVYDAKDKEEVHMHCMECGADFTIRRSIIHLHRNGKMTCPCCGNEATLKTKTQRLNLDDGRPAFDHGAIIQRMLNGFVIRYFKATRSYENGRKSVKAWEYHRDIYRPKDDGTWELGGYEWAVYKNMGDMTWCPGDGSWERCYSDAVLYTANLPDELRETPWEYSAVGTYQEQMFPEPIPLRDFMSAFYNHRWMEYLVKSRATKLVTDISNFVPWYYEPFNDDGKNLSDVLALNKPYLKALIRINGGIDDIAILRQMDSDNISPDAKVIGRYIDMFGSTMRNDEVLGVIDSHRKEMSLTKFMNYIEKETTAWTTHPKKYRMNTEYRQKCNRRMTDLWRDYLRFASNLELNLHDRYYLMPPNLTKAHDKAAEEVKRRQDEAVRKRCKAVNAMIQKISGETAELDAAHMKTKKLMIVVPKNGDDLVREGSILHHCVGTYREQVAKGQTMIFFVRKVSAPDTPFYTFEYKNGKIVQIRGYRNCDPPASVEAFVRAFGEKMSAEQHMRAGVIAV